MDYRNIERIELMNTAIATFHPHTGKGKIFGYWINVSELWVSPPKGPAFPVGIGGRDSTPFLVIFCDPRFVNPAPKEARNDLPGDLMGHPVEWMGVVKYYHSAEYSYRFYLKQKVLQRLAEAGLNLPETSALASVLRSQRKNDMIQSIIIPLRGEQHERE